MQIVQNSLYLGSFFINILPANPIIIIFIHPIVFHINKQVFVRLSAKLLPYAETDWYKQEKLFLFHLCYIWNE